MIVPDAKESVASLIEDNVRAWEALLRTGRRGDGASFTIDTISRYMIHDTIHHIWDVAEERTAST